MAIENNHKKFVWLLTPMCFVLLQLMLFLNKHYNYRCWLEHSFQFLSRVV